MFGQGIQSCGEVSGHGGGSASKIIHSPLFVLPLITSSILVPMPGILPTTQDKIRIEHLALPIKIGDQSRWVSATPQQEIVYVAVELSHDCARAAIEDNLSHSINYASISSRLKQISEESLQNKLQHRNLESLALEIAQNCFIEPGVEHLLVAVERPDALLGGKSVTYSANYCRGTQIEAQNETLSFNQLAVSTIIGVDQEERERRQLTTFDIELSKSTSKADVPFQYKIIADSIIEVNYLCPDKSAVAHVDPGRQSNDLPSPSLKHCATTWLRFHWRYQDMEFATYPSSLRNPMQ